MNQFLSPHPRKPLARNQQRSQAMNPGPQCLADQPRVSAFLEFVSCNAVKHTPPQKIECLHSRRVWLLVLFRVKPLWNRSHERSPVMMRVFQPELDVSDQPALQPLNGVAG